MSSTDTVVTWEKASATATPGLFHDAEFQADNGTSTLHFGVLGPFEVRRAGVAVQLGSIQPRAVLAYLLLHANRVTATSRLIAALWPGDQPVSARKMVQNSVWRIRKLLQSSALGGDVVLESHDSGYLLRIDPESLDLHRFTDLVAAGRESSRCGATADAAQRWREALALWRGPVLADLVEAGVDWPELDAARALRVDVLENYFEAELELGRHDAVLPELQAAALAEPRRERLVAQLMLALYRSGRHLDALDAYTAIRAELVETLGLEPGHHLRKLQQAILTHDDDLFGEPASRAIELGTVRPPAVVQERKQIVVMLLGTASACDEGLADPEAMDTRMACVHSAIAAAADRFGGVVTARVGSLWLITFGVRRGGGDVAMRAVCTALAVRHRSRHQRDGERPMLVRAVIETGEALVGYTPGNDLPPSVTGAVLDTVQAMLPEVPLDELWVGEQVRKETIGRIDYQPVPRPRPMWTVAGLRRADRWPDPAVLLGREAELTVLTDLYTEARRPRVALVSGGAGLGKTLLLAAFERAVTRRDPASAPLLVHVFPYAIDDSVLAMAAADVADWCGIRPDDPRELARAKLITMLERVVTNTELPWFAERLGAALGFGGRADPTELLITWWTLLERISAERPVIIVVDDLHVADDALLALLDRIVQEPSGCQLLVVAAGGPEVFDRRPGWAVAGSPVVTVPLRPLDAATIAAQVQLTGCRPELAEAVAALADGNPLLAAALSAAPEKADPVTVPVIVSRVLSVRLDQLPDRQRSVLLAAAALGEVVQPGDVALALDVPDDVPTVLEQLAAAGILESAADGSGYVFRQALLRLVAYARIPHRRLAAMHTLMAGRDGPASAGPWRPVVPEVIRWVRAWQRIEVWRSARVRLWRCHIRHDAR